VNDDRGVVVGEQGGGPVAGSGLGWQPEAGRSTPLLPEPVGVPECPRCGGDHGLVQFVPLARPVDVGSGWRLDHWAPCPVGGEPILAGDRSPASGRGVSVRATGRAEGAGRGR